MHLVWRKPFRANLHINGPKKQIFLPFKTRNSAKENGFRDNAYSSRKSGNHFPLLSDVVMAKAVAESL